MNQPPLPDDRRSSTGGCMRALLIGLGLLAAAGLLLIGICSR